MGHVRNLLLASGTTAASLGIVMGINGGLNGESLEEKNRPVTDCAAYLGSTAIEATELPVGCESSSHLFDQRVITIEEIQSDDDRDLDPEVTTTYSLISKDQFLDEHLITQQQYNSRQAFSKKAVTIIMAGSVAMVFAFLTSSDRQKSRLARVDLVKIEAG